MRFVEPEMNVTKFVAEDVITASNIEKPGNTGSVGGAGNDD